MWSEWEGSGDGCGGRIGLREVPGLFGHCDVCQSVMKKAWSTRVWHFYWHRDAEERAFGSLILADESGSIQSIPEFPDIGEGK